MAFSRPFLFDRYPAPFVPCCHRLCPLIPPVLTYILEGVHGDSDLICMIESSLLLATWKRNWVNEEGKCLVFSEKNCEGHQNLEQSFLPSFLPRYLAGLRKKGGQEGMNLGLPYYLLFSRSKMRERGILLCQIWTWGQQLATTINCIFPSWDRVRI